MEQSIVVDKLNIPRLWHKLDTVFVCIFLDSAQSLLLLLTQDPSPTYSIHELAEDLALMVEYDWMVRGM